MTALAHLEECPYSDPPFGELTDDHIFPQFMGGRAKIRVCRECNSRFGHSFEAESARQIKRLQVFISHFGLDLTLNAASWPSALVVGDKTYDLRAGPNGVQYELARPVIRRDDSGMIVSYQSRSRAEGQQIAQNLVRKGKAKRVEIEEAPGENLNDIKLGIGLSFNPGLYKFATKLVANAAVFMGRGSLVRNSGIAKYLHGTGEWPAAVAYCDTAGIRKLRPEMCIRDSLNISLVSPPVPLVLDYKKHSKLERSIEQVQSEGDQFKDKLFGIGGFEPMQLLRETVSTVCLVTVTSLNFLPTKQFFECLAVDRGGNGRFFSRICYQIWLMHAGRDQTEHTSSGRNLPRSAL